MIIFNIYSIIQLIISFLAILLVHVVGLIFGYDFLDSLFHSGGEIYALFIVIIVSMYTDVKGIKGRLFYIPVWILGLAVLVFITNTSHMPSSYRMSVLWPILLLGLYPFFLWLHHRKRFKIAEDSLEELTRMDINGMDDVTFFNVVQATVYNPPGLFFGSPNFWQSIGSPVLSGEDYINHYSKVLAMRPFSRIKAEPYEEWLQQLKQNLTGIQTLTTYPGNIKEDHKRIIQIITRQPAVLKREMAAKLNTAEG